MAIRTAAPGAATARGRRLTAMRSAFSRAVNDDLMRLGLAHGGVKQIVCECSTAECSDFLEITAGDYAAARAHPTRFLVTPGHELAAVQRVLTQTLGVAVIQERQESLRSQPPLNGRLPDKGKPWRVLIVDDDPATRLLCAANLEIAGLVVLEAPDGRRGLERARSERPDLVLTDVAMPGFDGFQLAEALLRDERTRQIPLIFLSGDTEAAHLARAHELGALAYLGKPFDAAAVASVVAGVVARLCA